jgi:chromosome segregation ATPase
MRPRKSYFLFRLIVFVFLAICMSRVVSAQANKVADDKETMQALLSEVTMLRQAMQSLQRMTLDTYRSQLIVERVRLQKEDVRRLAGALDQTRDDIMKLTRAIPNTIDQQKLFETMIPQESDPTKRAQLEFDLKRARDGVEMYKSQLERQRTREQEIGSELQISKSKLDDLEGRLDSIERAIDADREKLAEKPAAPPKP